MKNDKLTHKCRHFKNASAYSVTIKMFYKTFGTKMKIFNISAREINKIFDMVKKIYFYMIRTISIFFRVCNISANWYLNYEI